MQPARNSAKKAAAAASARYAPNNVPTRLELREAISRAASADLLKSVALPFALQRLCLFAIVAYAHSRLPSATVPWTILPDSWLDAWFRWDSAYYLRIASDGYTQRDYYGRITELVGFFPGYPYAIRLLALAMPAWLAALVVSNAALLAGLCFSFSIARDLFDERVARRSVWIALVFPTTFFWSAAYSDSLQFALGAGAVLAAMRGRPWIAAACVGYLTLTRPMAIVCLTLPFWIGWLARREAWRKLPWFTFAAALGAGVILAEHAIHSDDPLAFVKTGLFSAHGRYASDAPLPPWVVLANQGVGPSLMRRCLNWSALALALVSSIALWRRRNFELSALTLLSVLVPLLVQRTLFDATSMSRYLLGGFPVFFCLAQWVKAREPEQLLDGSFAALQLVLAYLFGANIWIE